MLAMHHLSDETRDGGSFFKWKIDKLLRPIISFARIRFATIDNDDDLILGVIKEELKKYNIIKHHSSDQYMTYGSYDTIHHKIG